MSFFSNYECNTSVSFYVNVVTWTSAHVCQKVSCSFNENCLQQFFNFVSQFTQLNNTANEVYMSKKCIYLNVVN